MSRARPVVTPASPEFREEPFFRNSCSCFRRAFSRRSRRSSAAGDSAGAVPSPFPSIAVARNLVDALAGRPALRELAQGFVFELVAEAPSSRAQHLLWSRHGLPPA